MNHETRMLAVVFVVGLPVLVLMCATADLFVRRNLALFLPTEGPSRDAFVRRFIWAYRASALAAWLAMFMVVLRAWIAAR